MKEAKIMRSFLEEYEQNIVPNIEAIDVFLKSAKPPFDVHCVADLLSINESEISSLLNRIGIKHLDKSAFLQVMSNGSSKLCKMLKKEIELGSPLTYTSWELGYIYNLDYTSVKNAYRKLQIKEATSFTMPLVFAHISV
ncbi:MAG: hypothetical protein FWE44_02445 [Defluviitaleaceae bacterium]|nr:hypothetical protein [Defluviitaleaceae bacterium]